MSCIAIDIDFQCVKTTSKRVAVAGMEHRCIEICADLRRLPFTDGVLTAAYTRYGLCHAHGYSDTLTEAYRLLRTGGSLVVTANKNSIWARGMDSYGIGRDEQIEIVRSMGFAPHAQELIQSTEQAGFSILASEELPKPKFSGFLVEAVKN